MIVTIDGPAGTGKTTVARRVAEALSFSYFDTGAMYRAFTWLVLENKIELTNLKAIEQLLDSFSFNIKKVNQEKRYFVNDIDVTEPIRSQEVTGAVSAVAALLPVRQALWKIQRAFAENSDAVFEGRDLGTVVFPKAEIKIFLTARPEVRAERRLKEIIAKTPENAARLNQDLMLQDIMRRDEIDSTREHAPLKCPEDALTIDTSDLALEQVVQRVLEYKKSKYPEKYEKGNLLYRAILTGAKLYFKIFYRHKVYGREHFCPGGAIIAGNHASFFDPPIAAISSPQEVHFLARETLFKNPLFGGLIRALNSHPVSGDPSDIGVFRLITSLLKEGKKVILFPEGQRASQDALGVIKPGIGMLLSRSGAFVLPIYIHGTFQVWNRFMRLPKLFGKTASVFGSPIRWEEFAHLEKKEAQRAFAERLTDSLTRLRNWYEEGAHGTPP